MPTAVSAPTDCTVAPSTGFVASLRKAGAFFAVEAHQIADAARASCARVVRYVAVKLSIQPTTVFPLALLALAIVAIVLQVRRS